ncbi:uncharacterized protein DC041_0000560 [Schistosoma bovis]|uniref:Uncharacterized protein n=1 Tax=Schistosoma bovis TaxID=6184 RepID=A0A430PZA4_SCHBO|nr:uncharacterized protein DC041_0000560 [Schistosoma bovis]
MAITITSVAVLIITTLLLNNCNAVEEYSSQSNLTLFNFTDPETFLFEDWIGVSDTFRVEGRSIAALVPHTAYNNQSAILYYEINPNQMDQVSLVSTTNWIPGTCQTILVLSLKYIHMVEIPT